jgi:DNA-binding transcriptional regulator YhcF (GntR family)
MARGKGTGSGERARGYGALHVFEGLRDEILSLELRPGQLIDEASLAERFHVSRSPVREALVRLAADGLVQTFPNKGTIVAPLNIEEFPAYIDALDLIQRAIFRLAATNRTVEDLVVIRRANDEFRARVRANDALGMIAQNARFHLAMGEAGRNHILTSRSAIRASSKSNSQPDGEILRCVPQGNNVVIKRNAPDCLTRLGNKASRESNCLDCQPISCVIISRRGIPGHREGNHEVSFRWHQRGCADRRSDDWRFGPVRKHRPGRWWLQLG